MASFLKKRLTIGSKEKAERTLESDVGETEVANFDGAEPIDEGFLLSDSEHSRARAWSSAEKVKLASLSYPFSNEQLEALGKFRKMVQKELSEAADFEEVVSDRRLIRFLRGHKFDFDVAAEMYRNMLIWRKEAHIDEIRNDIVTRNLQPIDFPVHGRVMRYYPSHIHHGEDKEGHPVHIELIGNVQPRKVLSSFSEEEFIRHHIYCMEYNSIMLDNLTKQKGRVMRIVLIYDMRGIGAGHLKSRRGWDLIKKTLAITQNYYPETMHKTFLLNVPKIFSLGWSILKPLLAERTQAKIQILGSNYKKLQDTISEENIPQSLGGSRPDEWPLVFDKKDFDSIDNEYKSIDINKGGKETIRVTVERGEFVVWGFFTKSGDINATVSLMTKNLQDDEEKGEEESVQVMAYHERHESSGGSFTVESTSEVILEFDNSFSWITRKTVHYYIYAVPKEQHRALDSPKNGQFKSFFN